MKIKFLCVLLLNCFTCLSLDYDKEYQNISVVTKQPVGIMVVAYNRPEYFYKVILSIEKNAESQHLPFYFFLDGGPKSKQKENIEIINSSKIKNKTIIIRNENYGCAKNLIDARRFMFDWCNFNKVIVLEDDMVISPHYFKITLDLHSWATKNYDNVGVVQCWSYCFLNVAQKRQSLHLVQNSGLYWWSFVSYCLDKSVWNKMKPILYEYESKFVDSIPKTDEFFKERSQPSLSKNVDKIRLWVQNLVKKKVKKPKQNNERIFKESNHGFSMFSSDKFLPNQDNLTALSLWLVDYIKIQTVVNRAIHIGENGLSFDEKLFKDYGYAKIVLDNFNEDSKSIWFHGIMK